MARVYVGTYAKYNAGSIAGAWINLDGCATYSDFLAECRKVHKDESDPEFMIQDAEGFPDGLSCLEWLSESDFNDVKDAEKEEEGDTPADAFTVFDYSDKAIAVVGDTRPLAAKFKALGGRFNPRLSCGAGWIFSKRQADAVRSLLGGAKSEPKPAGKKADEGAEYLATLDEWVATIDKGDKNYYRKGSAAAVKLPEGYFVVSKPRIENKFCFHDEGPDYELYKELHRKEENMRAYFLQENLADFDAKLKWLANKNEPIFVRGGLHCNTAEIVTRQYSWDWMEALRNEWRVLTDEEREKIAGALRFVRDGFEKRLQTYLKKYGVSKLHTWTYWADA